MDATARSAGPPSKDLPVDRRMLIALLLAASAADARSPSPWIASGPLDSRVIDARGDHMRTGPPGIVVRANGRTRSLDCGGGNIAIDGHGNRLTLANCQRVTIDGSGNRLQVAFAQPGNISLLGDRNQIAWSAAPALQVDLSDIGRHNRVRAR